MKGITVTLYADIQTGANPFGEAEYTELPIEVNNVLVAPASSQEILDTMNLYGKKAVYTLGIPKGDTHDWKDKRITFFDEDWISFGEPLKGIDALVPTSWNMKVMVARCE